MCRVGFGPGWLGSGIDVHTHVSLGLSENFRKGGTPHTVKMPPSQLGVRSCGAELCVDEATTNGDLETRFMAIQRDSALDTFARRVAGFLWSPHSRQPLLQPGWAASLQEWSTGRVEDAPKMNPGSASATHCNPQLWSFIYHRHIGAAVEFFLKIPSASEVR